MTDLQIKSANNAQRQSCNSAIGNNSGQLKSQSFGGNCQNEIRFCPNVIFTVSPSPARSPLKPILMSPVVIKGSQGGQVEQRLKSILCTTLKQSFSSPRLTFVKSWTYLFLCAISAMCRGGTPRQHRKHQLDSRNQGWGNVHLRLELFTRFMGHSTVCGQQLPFQIMG